LTSAFTFAGLETLFSLAAFTVSFSLSLAAVLLTTFLAFSDPELLVFGDALAFGCILGLLTLVFLEAAVFGFGLFCPGLCLFSLLVLSFATSMALVSLLPFFALGLDSLTGKLGASGVTGAMFKNNIASDYFLQQS
jgi:hypothetical protein